MTDPLSPSPPPDETRKDLQKKFVEFLVIAFPVALLTWLLEAFFGLDLRAHQYGFLILAVTFLLVAYAGWQLLKGVRAYTLGGRFRWFFALYMLLFILAASNDILNWRQELLGYRENVPRNFLALNRLGDWHYWFAPRPEAPQDVVVLTVPLAEDRTLEDTRATLMYLVQAAVLHGARAVGLDFYFDLESQVDPNFCGVIDGAWNRGLPVFAGYRHTVDGMLVSQVPTAASLPCLQGERLGHLAVYRERDTRVRMVPVDLGGREELKSLSYRLARLSQDPPRVPETRLLQFVEPDQGLTVLPYEDLEAGRRSWEIVRGRILLVGGAWPGDMHRTPYGERLGVMLHGYSVHALRTGRFIRRPSWWWSFPFVFMSCYLLSATFMQGAGLRRLAGLALLFHLSFLAVAVAAMRIWLVWLDVIYLALAVWVLLLLLRVVGRRLQTAQVETVLAAPARAVPESQP